MSSEILIFRSSAVNYLFDLVRVEYDGENNVTSRKRLIVGLTFEEASERLESGNF